MKKNLNFTVLSLSWLRFFYTEKLLYWNRNRGEPQEFIFLLFTIKYSIFMTNYYFFDYVFTVLFYCNLFIYIILDYHWLLLPLIIISSFFCYFSMYFYLFEFFLLIFNLSVNASLYFWKSLLHFILLPDNSTFQPSSFFFSDSSLAWNMSYLILCHDWHCHFNCTSIFSFLLVYLVC